MDRTPVDAFHAELLERLAHVVRAALPGVGHQPELGAAASW